MKKTFIWLLASLLFTLVGCVEGLHESGMTETSSEQLPDLTAGFAEGETRTYVESGKYLRWHEDDRLTAFYGNTLNRQYKFNGATGDNSGSFSYVSSGNLETGNALDRIYAVYPYDETATITDDGQISMTLPAVQTYAENSFGRGANTMLAVTENVEDTFLGFKNVCGYLKLKLYNAEGATIKSIEVKGNDEEKIAGAATATIAFGGVPQLTMADDATTDITLDCGDGVALGTTAEAATEFWVVIPETTFDNGITITVTDTEGGVFEKSTTKEVVIERNAVQPMAALGVEFLAPVVKPANNEIWYINGSTTEATTPYNTDVFGANIVSNIYDAEKGCWVIKFDGDVTKIGGYAFYNCKSLKSITIPVNVTTIGNNAFRLCTSLESITIPESVTTIGGEAFYYCSSLTSVTIPESVTTIGDGAFYYCSSLESLYCKAITPPNCDDSIFCYYDEYEETIYYEMIFGGKIYVPSVSVNVYRNTAYWSLENIVGYDFVCDEIATDEHVPANNEIWYTATEKVDPYDADAFDFNIHIQSNEWDERTGKGVITFDGYVTTIGDYAFLDCTMLTSVTLPNYVKEIGASAFMGCRSLTFVTIPDGVISIGHYAFNACSSLKLFSGKIASSDGRCLIINGELKAFAPAGLTRYNIPWGVTSIDYGTFHGCTNLTSVVISKDVTTIEDWAFYYCTSLTSVYCNPTTPPSLGVHVFDHAASGSYEIIPCNIYVPANSVEAYKAARYWKNHASNIVGR
ncbi:MAG: leucine-rich repeat domain-containing protein [Bacteroidales bacterium]|nr:leucine-rich repeat domain-containing protein [Bacteroidales bacterium]